jgi:hypothetical protein
MKRPECDSSHSSPHKTKLRIRENVPPLPDMPLWRVLKCDLCLEKDILAFAVQFMKSYSKHFISYARFEVLTAVLKIYIFWGVELCPCSNSSPRFEGS